MSSAALAVEARTTLGDLELDVALTVRAGECLALAGPSGAGKTSVLRTVAGLLRPASARVLCGGETWLDTEAGVDVPPDRRRCGYLFQEYALFGHLSAWRNVAYALHEVPRGEREARARELLARFGLVDRADARPAALSGGERQRVALARALARRPAALLLDEPLAALDARTGADALHEGPRGAREARARELLARFGLADRADARPAALSGGERQRVALARALARRPAALLLDEPLAALDARTGAAAARELAAVIGAAGVPVLLVTHDFAEAALLGDRVAVMDRGRVLQDGSASELAAAPASAFVADFTGAVVLTGQARRGADGETLIALDGGGELTALEGEPGAVAVSVYPWEIALARPGEVGRDSARNHLDVEVLSVTTVGARVRVGLAAPQPLTAELSEHSARSLGLERGMRAVASFKAAATRVLPR